MDMATQLYSDDVMRERGVGNRLILPSREAGRRFPSACERFPAPLRKAEYKGKVINRIGLASVYTATATRLHATCTHGESAARPTGPVGIQSGNKTEKKTTRR